MESDFSWDRLIHRNQSLRLESPPATKKTSHPVGFITQQRSAKVVGSFSRTEKPNIKALDSELDACNTQQAIFNLWSHAKV